MSILIFEMMPYWVLTKIYGGEVFKINLRPIETKTMEHQLSKKTQKEWHCLHSAFDGIYATELKHNGRKLDWTIDIL